MPGRHQRRRQHGVVVFGLALAAQPGRAVRAADAARTIILCAVERDQHPPADPAEAVRAAVDPAKLPDRLREHRAQQRRFGRVQHVADVVVAGNSGDAEQAGAVGRLAQLDRPWSTSNCRWCARNDGLCMKNTENPAIPMSGRRQVVFNPRRLSANRHRHSRNDPGRASGGRIPTSKPDFPPQGNPPIVRRNTLYPDRGFPDSGRTTHNLQPQLSRIENCCIRGRRADAGGAVRYNGRRRFP